MCKTFVRYETARTSDGKSNYDSISVIFGLKLGDFGHLRLASGIFGGKTTAGDERALRLNAVESISNSNWTEWSTIQGVIERVISKSDEREARGRFEITSTITP